MGTGLRKGIAWDKIRSLWRAGESARSLGKRFPVSHQAILARSKKENWQADNARAATKAVVVATYPGLVDTQAATPEKLANIISGYGEGLSKALIAGKCGLAIQTITNYRDKDSDFDLDCEQASAEYLSTINGHITAASPRDWRASEAILRRHPMTRDEYQEAPVKTPQIIISVQRAVMASEESVLIDITPSPGKDDGVQPAAAQQTIERSIPNDSVDG